MVQERQSATPSVKPSASPQWREGADGIPGGRDVGREIVETYYANNRPSGSYKGCASYADFREMLEKQKGMDAVKIMTPDHLHATISIAAMKKGKHVMMHKPIANRLYEARQVMETARDTRSPPTSFRWDSHGSMDLVMSWIKDGAIGKLREVHNWSNRPGLAAVPDTAHGSAASARRASIGIFGSGPAVDRPYHPNYTHNVFAAGTISAAAPSPTWATTACGWFSAR